MAVAHGYKQTTEHVRKRIEGRLQTPMVKPKPVSREWLIEKYVAERLDCVQISKIVERDPKTVWAWMKHYAIPTRPRGGMTLPHAFVKGQVSPFTGKKHTLETKSKLREIALNDGRVPYDPAVGSYMKWRRGPETPNWKGGLTPERQAFYSSAEWKDAVKAVWARADARCERCGVHHNTTLRRGTFHVHHVVSFAVRELRATVSNLVLLCRDCHHFVHSSNNVKSEFIGSA